MDVENASVSRSSSAAPIVTTTSPSIFQRPGNPSERPLPELEVVVGEADASRSRR